MNFMESHFWYTKRQRNGILFLFIVLFAVQAALFLIDFSEETNLNEDEYAQIQLKIDSLKKAEKQDPKPKIYPFNPNYITDFRAYQLGLSPEEIDRLIAFRKTGKFVNSPAEFQHVTRIDDYTLNRISPYFKFPDWIAEKRSQNKKSTIAIAPSVKRDMNKATLNQLMQVKGLNLKMARRIIAYRDLIKGFTVNDQLFEVYDLDSISAARILEYFIVFQKPEIQKTNVNTASFKEILHTPYIDYELTKKICNYRDLNGPFPELESLKKIDSFPIKKFDRIALYLSAE